MGGAVCVAAAAYAMAAPGQLDWAEKQGATILVPVRCHIEGAAVVGVARLRYRPRTSRTAAFIAREAQWRNVIARMDELPQGDRAAAEAWMSRVPAAVGPVRSCAEPRRRIRVRATPVLV